MSTAFILHPSSFIAGLVAALLCVGCGHISVPFVHMKPKLAGAPEEAVRALARDVEQAILEGNREAQIPDREGLSVNTPIIMQAIRMRAIRSQALGAFLDTGFAYEKPNGLVYILTNKDYKKATDRKQRNRHALIVSNETENRWTLYEELVKTSALKARSRSAVQQIFYEARMELMPPGRKYEDLEGVIVTKGAGGENGAELEETVAPLEEK